MLCEGDKMDEECLKELKQINIKTDKVIVCLKAMLDKMDKM